MSLAIEIPASPSPYTLLNKYMSDANVLSRAYKLNELFYLSMHKFLTYPIIVLSTFSTVIAGLRREELEYVLLGLTLVTLLFAGFNTAITPKDKQYLSNKISTEFSEIALNINQFIIENNKSPSEIKVFSQKMLALFEVWKSLCPEIRQSYLLQAKLECAERVERVSNSSKKRLQI